MIPDVPPHLIRIWNPLAGNDDAVTAPAWSSAAGITDWSRHLRDANRSAAFGATQAERDEVREFGLVVRRPPANLGEHGVDDRLGREVMRELAKRQRGG